MSTSIAGRTGLSRTDRPNGHLTDKWSGRPYGRRYDRNRQARICDALHLAFATPKLDRLGLLLAIAHIGASAHASPEFWLNLQATYDLKTLPTRNEIDRKVEPRERRHA
ncbi:hypothetical protein [Burkholderia sp. PU8-34]